MSFAGLFARMYAHVHTLLNINMTNTLSQHRSHENKYFAWTCCLKRMRWIHGKISLAHPRTTHSMYHIEVHIHTDSATSAPPYNEQQTVATTESSTSRLTTTADHQRPVSPVIRRPIQPGTLLYQKGKGLCAHFNGCGHIQGRNRQHISQYTVCNCLTEMTLSRTEKSPLWADSASVLHQTSTCTRFNGNVVTSLTACRDCFRRN